MQTAARCRSVAESDRFPPVSFASARHCPGRARILIRLTANAVPDGEDVGISGKPARRPVAEETKCTTARSSSDRLSRPVRLSEAYDDRTWSSDGSQMVKVVPSPGVLTTRICPPAREASF